MKAQLKNWSYGSGTVDPYTPPETIVTRLEGNVYNHPDKERHPDGKLIVTSAVMGKRNGLVVTYSGSEYELLEPAAEYEKLFPGAKERLLKNLPTV